MPIEDTSASSHSNEPELQLQSEKCCELHLHYIGECHRLEEFEAAPHDDNELTRVRERVEACRQAWVAAAELVMKTPARTYRELRAKASVLRGLLREVADNNLQGVFAALTFLDEVERVLNDRA